jgi:hypothetical protein
MEFSVITINLYIFTMEFSVITINLKKKILEIIVYWSLQEDTLMITAV